MAVSFGDSRSRNNDVFALRAKLPFWRSAPVALVSARLSCVYCYRAGTMLAWAGSLCVLALCFFIATVLAATNFGWTGSLCVLALCCGNVNWSIFGLIVTQMWVVFAASSANLAFEAFVTAQPFKTQVTKSSSLEGPCVALFLTAPKAGDLPQPSPHQRWWGLVPNAHLDHVEASVDDMIVTRARLWRLIMLIMWTNLFQLGHAVIASSALDPTRMLKIYGGLSSAGLNLLLTSSFLLSQYGIYYDAELGLPVVNYVPGWAYVNLVMVMFAVISLVLFSPSNWSNNSKWIVIIIMGLLCLYALFWLVIPLFGYTYFFAHDFVWKVANQEEKNGGTIDTGLILATGESLVIHDAVAEDLEAPFAFAGFTGLFCFFYCLIKYYRLLNDETAEAAKKDTPEKKAAAKTTDQEKSEKIVDSDGRAESAAESVVKESASTAAVEAPGVADEKAKLMAEA